MGRQNCDPTTMHSSIALLQERFRQLERAKEMRQQKDLLRLFTEAEQVKSAKAYEPSRLSLHPELTHSPEQPFPGSLHLQPNMSLQINETPNWAHLHSRNSDAPIANNFDESDVDTSLHL